MRHARKLPIVISALAAACSGHSHGGADADEYIVDCETLGGVGGASDENFVSFINAEAAGRVVREDARSPQLTAPASGTTLSAAAPPPFSFTPVQAQNSAGPRTYIGRACAAPSRRASGLAARARALAQALLLEGTAHAHCAAFTGESYLFRLTEEGSVTAIYSAMLSVTSFTPDATIWQRVMGGRLGKTLTLTIQRGIFFQGKLMEGPYLSTQPITFTVGP